MTILLYDRRDYMETKTHDVVPIVLTTGEVKDMLGCGQRQAYELMHNASFPSFRIGKRLYVRKDRFLEWLDRQVV